MVNRRRWEFWAIFTLVLCGLALRSYHYLRCPEIWHDEAALVVNALEKDFGALLGPLRFHEAAPPGFLWAERLVTLFLGDDLYSLRLLPFLASCAALILMVPLSRRWLPPAARPWALLLFAFSEQLCWHSCEAKPYATDVLTAMILLLIWSRDEISAPWRLLAAAVLAPILLPVSFPSCFVYGALLTAAMPSVWREQRLASWLSYSALAIVVGVVFLCLLLGPVRAQRDGPMEGCWTQFFADWNHPWSVPTWALIQTSEAFRYCFKPLGQVLALAALLGAVVMVRSGRGERVVLLALPLGLALIAACLQRYPYGGARVIVYATPGLSILIAAGVGVLWRRRFVGSVSLRVALALVLLLPIPIALYRAAVPWERPAAAAAADFVASQRRPDDVVVGNDGIHAYYCRRMGRAFTCGGFCETPRPSGERVWVLYTDLKPHEQRLHDAQSLAPGHWRVLQSRAFHYTSVVLLARNHGANGDPHKTDSE
jgi:hypothetical protein